MPLPTVERVEAFFEFLRERLETARKWARRRATMRCFGPSITPDCGRRRPRPALRERLTIDTDATPITSDSEKEHAAGRVRLWVPSAAGVSGSDPQGAGRETARGNAGANTAADHVTVLDLAIVQIPAEYVEQLEILVRADSAGATHELADHCHERDLRCSFG